MLLDASKARRELGWQPRYALSDAIDHTVAWYRAFQRGDDLAAFTRRQISAYQQRSAA